jgi:alginate O-acetyltransferase complex protein AlgI
LNVLAKFYARNSPPLGGPVVFSSVVFLMYFLPVFLAIYLVVPGTTAKNIFLLLASILFYTWGEPWFVSVLLVVIAFNYAIAVAIDASTGGLRTAATALGIAANLLVLGTFKYLDFFVENINWLFSSNVLGIPRLGFLPLGLSFIAFHAISYLVDIHRRKVFANRDPLQIAVYLSMFPQLVAGPIVRYNTIYRQLAARRVTFGRASAGIRIFIIGLAQKVLIADEVARIAEAVFDRVAAPSLLESWLGVSAYTLQIYFDFMGYSNMAIGLAIAIGVRFPRNFRLPYTSRSVTEFWRRWHMSLSAWFRDYVYIPLGGNRGSDARTYINLGTVFLLCGLWHGANWTFIIWGIHHGIFLVVERACLSRWLKAAPPALSWLYAILAVMTGWVWFRAKDYAHAIDMFGAMAGLNGFAPISMTTNLVLYPTTVGAMVIGAMLAAASWLPRLDFVSVHRWAADTARTGVLFILSGLAVAAGSYSPFLYFRF